MKVCPRCLEMKDLSEFSRQYAAWDGRQAWCKACHLEYLKLRREGRALVRKTKPKVKTCAECGEERSLTDYLFVEIGKQSETCVYCHAARLRSTEAGTDDVGQQGNTSKGEVMPAKTKSCTRCKKRRKVDSFYRDKTRKDGLSTWCKECTKDYDREYRARKKAEATA